MMDDIERIEIAKDYIAKHKVNDLRYWAPRGITGDAKYLAIYENMVNSVYGNTRLFDQGNGPEYEIEIPAHDTANGKPCIFWWLKDSE